MRPLKLTIAALAWLAAAPGAGATTIDVLSSDQGWITQGGISNGSYPNNNYIVGNCGVDDCENGEYRDFFIFNLKGLFDVTSATLILNTYDVNLLQTSSIVYTVTSTPAQSFGSLGTGTVYGTRGYTVTDANQVERIELNAAALSDIASGGLFEISGRVTSPTTFGPHAANQDVFSFSHGSATLELVAQGTPFVPTPEPATWLLMTIGSGAIGLALRKKGRAVTA